MAIPPTGGNALFNQPGIESRARRRKKKVKAVCTCQRVEKATGAPGELIKPGVRRIRGNLCNVHGRYGPCDSSSAGTPKKAPKGKKPPKATLTPAQRAQARDAEHTANRGKTLAAQGYSADDQSALEALRSGAQPGKVSTDLIDQGVVEQATDGSYRLTSSGRALMNAAGQGDAGRARDTVSSARDRLSARRLRQEAARKRRQDAAGKRTAAQIDRELSKRSGSKKPSSGGGSKKPAQSAPKAPRAMDVRRRRSGALSGTAAPSVSSGKKPQPKPEKPAKAPAKQIAPALQSAAQALSDGADVSDEQLGSLIRNGLAKLNRDGEPILTAAGLRATMKEQLIARWNGHAWVKDGVVVSEPDQMQFAGHTMEDWDDTKPDSFYKTIPTFTVIKSSDGTPDRWLAITTTAYEDKDREIISTKAIGSVVAFGDKTQDRGPLRYWHVPGLDIGDCDFQAQGGPGGRFLIEGGTFRSKAFAQLGQKLSDSGYQMSPGFIHTDDQPINGVYDNILIYERSAVPQNRAANYFTRYATKEDKVITPEKAQEYREKAAGNDEALALLDTLLATTAKEDATAQARNVVFKEETPAPSTTSSTAKIGFIGASPAPLEIQIGDIIYTMKAFPPAAVEGSPEEEASEPADEAMAEGDDMQDDGSGMDDAAFAQMIAQAVVQALSPLLDMEKKMAGHVNDMKSMVSGIGQQKDDATAAQAAQIAALDAKLKELTGDLPSSVMNGAAQLYRPSQSPLTKLTESATAVVKEQISQVPAGLTDPSEIAAYQLIFGNT